MFCWAAWIRGHRAPDDVGVADLVNAGKVLALPHAGKERRKVVKLLGDDMDCCAWQPRKLRRSIRPCLLDRRCAGLGESEKTQPPARFAAVPHGATVPAEKETYNVNGRLLALMRGLEFAEPDIVCLQELKAPQDKFPDASIAPTRNRAIWHGDSRWNDVAVPSKVGDTHETRRGGRQRMSRAATSKRLSTERPLPASTSPMEIRGRAPNSNVN
jgi:hypothetical protein